MQVGSLVGGKYRILHMLGEGGMGQVWRAKNEMTERDFAIKFLHPGTANPDRLKRFFQEAKVAGRLRHPSIVEIFDAGTEPSFGGAPYLVMELLDGVGLDEAIARAGRLPLGIALEILCEIARGLALAHAQGIIHRDLKPSNVFLHRTGSGSLVPKLLDFGISKVTGEMSGPGVTTRTGAVMGSPLYMSPEQAAGDKSIDARSDVHALGVMLWECLVGVPPFRSETYGLLMVEVISGARPRLEDALPGAPAGVCGLIARAMSQNRAERYADGSAFANALEGELAAVGHNPLLTTRAGDERFFALLGKPRPANAATSTTTAVVDVAGKPISAVAAPTPASVASAPAADTVAAQSLPRDADPILIPTRSPGRALAVGLAVAVLAIAGGIVLALRFATPTQAVTEPPVASQNPALSVTAEPARPEPPPNTVLAPAEPPRPSASVADKPSQRPVGVRVRKPIAPAASATTSANAPVHRGVVVPGF